MNLQRLKQQLAKHRLLEEAAAGDGGEGGGGGGEGESKAGTEGNQGGEGEGGNKSEGEGEGKPKPKTPSLSDQEAKLLKEVMQYKGETKTLKEQLKAFEGIDPKQVKELLDAKKQADDAKKAAEEAELARKGEWDKLKKQMNDAHADDIRAKEAAILERESAISTLSQQVADLTVGHAFEASPYIREDLALTSRKTRQLFGSHFAYEDGKVVAYDKPAGAKDRAMLIDGKGDPLPFEAALKKLVDADPDKDSLYKSKVKEGARSSTNNINTTNAGNKRDDGASEEGGLSRIKAGLSAQVKK